MQSMSNICSISRKLNINCFSVTIWCIRRRQLVQVNCFYTKCALKRSLLNSTNSIQCWPNIPLLIKLLFAPLHTYPSGDMHFIDTFQHRADCIYFVFSQGTNISSKHIHCLFSVECQCLYHPSLIVNDRQFQQEHTPPVVAILKSQYRPVFDDASTFSDDDSISPGKIYSCDPCCLLQLV